MRTALHALLALAIVTPAVAQQLGPNDLGRFPALPYRGPVRSPVLKPGDDYIQFRTRIREGAKAGANFAGDIAVVEIGCGAGCRFVPVVNVRTGKVDQLPLGGEDNMYLDLLYRPDSRLMIGQWEGDRCMREAFLWSGSAFKSQGKVDLGPPDACRSHPLN